MNEHKTWFCVLFLTACAGLCARGAQNKPMSNFDRALEMLDNVTRDVQKHYYDPSFHGVDWKGKVQEARDKIKHETSLNMSMAHIAAALDSLNDSHTFFLPPSRPFHHSYGFETEMIGDQCFITHVRPGSDAETKGLKPGVEILSWDGYRPTRQNLWKMNYGYKILRPQPGVRLTLRDPQGQQRQADVAAQFKQTERVKDLTGNGIWDVVREMERGEHQMRARTENLGDQVMILKFPEFFFDPGTVDKWISEARKHQGLIVDLRGNAGGSVETLKELVSGIFEGEVKIADRVGRNESKPEVAKPLGHTFTGKLVVLVDSQSASASELFARLVQLQKRGVVMGDRSTGAVMEARYYDYQIGFDTVVFYGVSITEADLIMSDGKSLEHVGVAPDELILPTPVDLAAGRDPVLAHAAETLGVKLSPKAAGKLFPYEWAEE